MAEKMCDRWPDGSEIDSWFSEYKRPQLEELGKQFVITDFGAKAIDVKCGVGEKILSTKAMQDAIDAAAEFACGYGSATESGLEDRAVIESEKKNNCGAVVVFPEGIYMSGTIYMKPGVNLWFERGAVLLGSPDVSDYSLGETRIEGQNCLYFGALIEADECDGLVIAGEGTIDGNGLKSWENFALRRKWNPKCTNKDEQRPRLIFIQNSSNVTIDGITMQNSHFWNNHIYKCDHVRFSNLKILSPKEPVKAPSTDAIDVDACQDVHITNCYMAVNDDAVAIKGGKGPWADTDEDNGTNERILIENCEYGFCHGCLTVGSESVHTKNVILRHINVVEKAVNLLWLKLRPDTPSEYEYITVDDVNGEITNFININPWTQFFDLEGRDDKPISLAHNITMQNCSCKCYNYFNVKRHDEQYRLYDFSLKDLDIEAKVRSEEYSTVDGISVENVELNVV